MSLCKRTSSQQFDRSHKLAMTKFRRSRNTSCSKHWDLHLTPGSYNSSAGAPRGRTATNEEFAIQKRPATPPVERDSYKGLVPHRDPVHDSTGIATICQGSVLSLGGDLIRT